MEVLPCYGFVQLQHPCSKIHVFFGTWHCSAKVVSEVYVKHRSHLKPEPLGDPKVREYEINERR